MRVVELVVDGGRMKDVGETWDLGTRVIYMDLTTGIKGCGINACRRASERKTELIPSATVKTEIELHRPR